MLECPAVRGRDVTRLGRCAGSRGRHAVGTMSAVDWLPLVSTAAGAAIAFAGTVVADMLRRRDSRHRWDFGERRQAYSQLVLAIGAGLEGLRQVARLGPRGTARVDAASDAISAADVYVAREKVVMFGEPEVIRAAEQVFDRLIEVRDVVRAGADTNSPEYHDVYHPYAEAMWQLRLAVRHDLGASALSPSDVGRDSWEGRDTCATCRARDTVPPQPTPASDPVRSRA